nr:hypothetical protein [Streptomyces sp. NRRL S-1824]
MEIFSEKTQVTPASGTKSDQVRSGCAVRGAAQESRDLRVTVVSPGFTQSELTNHGGSAEAQAAARAAAEQLSIPASAIADAIAFAIGQPDNVDVNELIVRPTAQA